jgi:hypothetical protein
MEKDNQYAIQGKNRIENEAHQAKDQKIGSLIGICYASSLCLPFLLCNFFLNIKSFLYSLSTLC